MAIPREQAMTMLRELRDPVIQRLFAQAHAKHVLYEVRETPEHFPAFDIQLDDKVTFVVYALLAAGCSLAEQGDRAAAAPVLERAASLLQYVHGPFVSDSRDSSFHVLLAAMAFYVAGHYSRAFVAMRGGEEQTSAARIIGAFLRKDVGSVIEGVNEVLLVDRAEPNDLLDLDEQAITLGVAKAVAVSLEFIFTGAKTAVAEADLLLADALVVASCGNHPAWWWVIRLLRLMLCELREASPWETLPPHFGSDSADGLSRFIRVLAFMKRPAAELWTAQRAALPLALDAANRGAVVNLRTSAGKTRVAELAILQSLLNDPTSRVLYLAPFRSLALEVEDTLAKTFQWLGYSVSHLYGGSRVSAVDTELAAESAIIIATPEKARALFRASPEALDNVRLIVADEGHLIGASERNVRNELFLDHLRCFAKVRGARLLLLSAVLPNPQDLAEWITGDATAVAKSTWKPSAERFGVLRWDGRRVRINWLGEVASFNPSFVEAGPLGFGKRVKDFPRDKNEAVAASAVRLSALGPVMIFTGRAVSVPTLAKAALLALGEFPEPHPWPDHEWRVFEAVCAEELEPDAVELRAARAGVVCHSNRLTPQVRLALEHLMRAKPPRIIIATTTLAQGVNVGISSVIVATPEMGQDAIIDKRDFWNICGRAGRAFVDGEGKILYAIDDTRERWQVQKDERRVQYYFEAGAGDRVESGLLAVVSEIHSIAEQAQVPFDLLLELAAENDFSPLGNVAGDCERLCDLVDDGLLALHEDPVANPMHQDPATWVEEVFRESLAAIQARVGILGMGEGDVLDFLTARANSTVRRTPHQARRRALIASGLPLAAALRIQADLDVFQSIADSSAASDGELSLLVVGVREIEEWVRGNVTSVTGNMPGEDRLDAIREGWLGGIGLQKLCGRDSDAPAICREFYGYSLPWIIHAASQQVRILGEADRADSLMAIALRVELGVPNETAARLFLAGIRSRVAASEISAVIAPLQISVSQIRRALMDPKATSAVRTRVSPPTREWLDLLQAEGTRKRERLPEYNG